LFAGLSLARLPPVERWTPPFLGDLDMRIARDGTWFYLGSPINRPALVRLFAGILRREGDDHFLVTPVEKYRIRVDDAPFLAVEMRQSEGAAGPALHFRTNVDDLVSAGPDHPIRVATDPGTGEPSTYIEVRAGLEALLTRAVFYELAGLAIEHDGRVGVWSDGAFFPLDAPNG
jgi:hypothetical protein